MLQRMKGSEQLIHVCYQASSSTLEQQMPAGQHRAL